MIWFLERFGWASKVRWSSAQRLARIRGHGGRDGPLTSGRDQCTSGTWLTATDTVVDRFPLVTRTRIGRRGCVRSRGKRSGGQLQHRREGIDRGEQHILDRQLLE